MVRQQPVRARVIASSLAVVGLLAVAATAQAASFDISGPASGGIDAGGNVDVNLVVADPGTITDINVRVTESGPYAADITITLIHDGGTSITLFLATTDSGGSMDAVFDDSAVGFAPKTGTISGTFKPDAGTLAAFNGETLAGTWTLRFNDSIVTGDGDSLTAWSIFGTTASVVPEPGTFALFGLGLGGLGLIAVRRRRRAKPSA